jgi:hypothetical protein
MKWMPHSVFCLAAPAARARVFARLDRAGAGRAADGGIALGDQRMPGQAVFDHVFLKILAAPMGQRVDLDPEVALVLEEVSVPRSAF